MVTQNSQGTQGSKKMTRLQSKTSQPSQSSVSKSDKKRTQQERGQILARHLAEKRSRGETIKKARSKSKRAGIHFPVSRILRHLKEKNPRLRVRSDAGVLLTSILEYLTAEILELAGDVSSQFHRKRIIPRDLFLAIRSDDEFENFFSNAILTQSGVVPHIHPDLIGTKKSRTANLKTEKKEATSSSENQKPSPSTPNNKRKHAETENIASESKRNKH